MQVKQTYGFVVGENYYVETVTKYWIGKCLAISGPFSVVLSEACWVPATGRFGEFLKGKFDNNTEFEIVPSEMWVNVQWIDFMPWPHELPRKPK